MLGFNFNQKDWDDSSSNQSCSCIARTLLASTLANQRAPFWHVKKVHGGPIKLRFGILICMWTNQGPGVGTSFSITQLPTLLWESTLSLSTEGWVDLVRAEISKTSHKSWVHQSWVEQRRRSRPGQTVAGQSYLPGEGPCPRGISQTCRPTTVLAHNLAVTLLTSSIALLFHNSAVYIE